MLPSAELLLLRGDSNLVDSLFVGVGGVLTIIGVLLSAAAGGVAGGVPVSSDLGLDWRRILSAEPLSCCFVSITAFFGLLAALVVGSSTVGFCAGGSSGVGFVEALAGLVSAVAGRLSGLLDALLPVCGFVKLRLDLRRPLIRPAGEGDLLLEREVGGARLFGLGDPDGSGSSKCSVVDMSSEGREP